MMHRMTKVEVPQYPVLRITFEDGLTGEIDLSSDIASKPIFSALADEAFFRSVKLGSGGFDLGWRLDDVGNEIDLSADGIRIDIETDEVRDKAKQYRSRIRAAQ